MKNHKIFINPIILPYFVNFILIKYKGWEKNVCV